MDWDKHHAPDAFTPLTSTEYEAKIKDAHYQKQQVTSLPLDIHATSLTLPTVSSHPARQLELFDKKNPIKALLYRAIVAAYNYVFFNETAAASSIELFIYTVPAFVNWLNAKEIGNKYLLLKEYETDWFDARESHGGLSPLIKIKTVLFFYAFEESIFTQQLTPDEASFFKALSSTKISKQTRKNQESLANYFGATPWLRDEDVGIGNNLHRFLASPKITVSSLKALVSTVIIEFYEAKTALRNFLLVHTDVVEIMNNVIPQNKQLRLSTHERRMLSGRAIFRLFEAFHELASPPKKLANAMSLIAVSSLSTRGMKYHSELTKSKASLYEIFQHKHMKKCVEPNSNYLSKYISLTMTGKSSMFSIPVLLQLSNSDAPLPITEIERLMFSWLMASLTVQPDDIKKLTTDDFRLMKIGQRITDIECEYFKGRSNAIHITRSLSVKKNEGKALLTYLHQHPYKELQTFESSPPSNTSGGTSLIGNLVYTMSLPFMDAALLSAHHDLPMVIPKAIKSLVQYGVNIHNLKGLTKKALAQAKTTSKRVLFGLRAIKNSAVHAFSDPYTLHYLINRNSHSNQTEKTHYLTEENERWINASGRITRSVMFDLINNVFDLDFTSTTDDVKLIQKMANFNFEFESVSQLISYKSEDMLARLQIVTGQTLGRINEVGVMSHPAKSQFQFAPIYVLDSPVTVCKMRNYLSEFKSNYKKLLNQNPDNFYQTVLPTVEWIEQVLSTKLSSESIKNGNELFENMQHSGVSMQVFHSF